MIKYRRSQLSLASVTFCQAVRSVVVDCESDTVLDDTRRCWSSDRDKQVSATDNDVYRPTERQASVCRVCGRIIELYSSL